MNLHTWNNNNKNCHFEMELEVYEDLEEQDVGGLEGRKRWAEGI